MPEILENADEKLTARYRDFTNYAQIGVVSAKAWLRKPF